MKAVTIEKTEGKPGEVYYPLKFADLPKPKLENGQVMVKMLAAALNHRDLFIRQHLYPAVSFDTPLLADGVGVVVDASSPELEKAWKGKKVVLTPGRGWNSSRDGPEERYAILGGTSSFPLGTLQEYAAVSADEVEVAPSHLEIPEAASLPLSGLTAWRATFTKANVQAGHNVLITGIGGGVALFALQFASAAGANVYVTSSSADKLKKAQELGAKGGVNYKDEDWHKQLKEKLPKDRPYLDSVIDGAGGDIVVKTTSILKLGGIICSYGMTLGPKVTYTMQAVLKNIEMRGSTMGSRSEFSSMIKFVAEKKLRPVVSMTVNGIEKADECFEEMKKANQFGKLVIVISSESDSSKL